MTSQERVRATLGGKPVDRVASDFRAEPEVYEKLRKHLKVADDEAVRIWAKSDFRDLAFICNTGGHGGYNSFGWKDKNAGNSVQEDFWGVRRAKVNYGGGSYIDIVHYPLKTAAGLDEIRKYQFPDPRKIFDFAPLPEMVGKLNKDNEYFIMIEGESLYDRCWAVRGIEEFMMDLMADEQTAEYIIERNWKFFYEYTRMILESAGGCVDAIGLYNDLGNQHGMMISPSLYRKFFKERQRKFIKMIKSFGAKVFYHSCGNILEILEDLIEIGVDILDPLQLKAMNIAPKKLADIVGNRLALHGGLDTQALLVNGSPAEIRSAIFALKKDLGKYGKYIFSCAHYLQMDVPLKNIETIVAEVI
ncbi:MAG: hypothetical protein NT011_02130 [Kiritimatiellaeota bacterium]|nr:hypothetical protein [Kiritimatiellota bacterium]